ncbi:MAG: hypothetical protein U0556_08500 [Dehalococcoidia bacterium]
MTPLVEGIQAAVITVSDFEPSLRVYRDALGWEVVAEGDLTAVDSSRLWGVEAACRIVALSPLSVETGRIHLVRFDGLSPASLGQPQSDGYGLFAIDMYVRDLEEARRRCEAAGARWAGGPATWHIGDDLNRVTVRQGFLHLPDDVNLTFVMPGRPRPTAVWARDPDALCTELTSVVVCVPDVERSKVFWGADGLGLVEQYDAEFAQPEMARMVGLPDDFAQRMAFLIGDGTARLELTGRPRQHSDAAWRSLDLAARQRPGRSLGQCAWVVVVDRFDEAISVAQARGGQLLSGPFTIDNPVYAGRSVAIVETPERTLLEIWSAR